jgi:hypothetical protein
VTQSLISEMWRNENEYCAHAVCHVTVLRAAPLAGIINYSVFLTVCNCTVVGVMARARSDLVVYLSGAVLSTIPACTRVAIRSS